MLTQEGLVERQGKGRGDMATGFTRRFTPATSPLDEWMVLVGEECAEHLLMMRVPCENAARRLLKIDKDVPILIGRP